MTVAELMPNRMNGNPSPTEADLTTGAPDEFASRYFSWFRRSIRYALWPVWPNNLAVGDDEIIEAVRKAIDELVERRRNDDGGMEAPNRATLFAFLTEWEATE